MLIIHWITFYLKLQNIQLLCDLYSTQVLQAYLYSTNDITILGIFKNNKILTSHDIFGQQKVLIRLSCI